jgi:hypothetical protein
MRPVASLITKDRLGHAIGVLLSPSPMVRRDVLAVSLALEAVVFALAGSSVVEVGRDVIHGLDPVATCWHVCYLRSPQAQSQRVCQCQNTKRQREQLSLSEQGAGS